MNVPSRNGHGIFSGCNILGCHSEFIISDSVSLMFALVIQCMTRGQSIAYVLMLIASEICSQIFSEAPGIKHVLTKDFQ